MSAQRYLDKYGYFPRCIKTVVQPNTDIIIVIPCYNETSIIPTMQSLSDCEKPDCHTEVIVVLNSSEKDLFAVNQRNKASLKEALLWKKENFIEKLSFEFIEAFNLPEKIAGVGMARKTGMDEAVMRFSDLDKDGVIVGFDADSLCETNYLIEINKYFLDHPKINGCSIYFEHPLKGSEFKNEVYVGILNYELHLRYYMQAFRHTGHPYAFHTVGSSFAVRSSAYMKQGGMNRRKAGEDFYFIQKIVALRKYGDLNTTKVIPSPRPSDRVPFGTGRAIMQWVSKDEEDYKTYDLKAFLLLKKFFQLIPEFYIVSRKKLDIEELVPLEIQVFLRGYFFEDRLREFEENSGNINSYMNRFFNWFNAFLVLKFVHFYRDNYSGMVPIKRSAQDLAQLLDPLAPRMNVKELLEFYRKLERE